MDTACRVEYKTTKIYPTSRVQGYKSLDLKNFHSTFHCCRDVEVQVWVDKDTEGFLAIDLVELHVRRYR